MEHPYTTEPLAGDDPRFVSRHPGALEIERLFPSPVSVGRGSLAIEGGVSVVAGPGMGKSSLLAQLSRRLDRERGLATGLVALPPVEDHPGDDGFFRYLGELVRRTRESLSASPRLREAEAAPVARALAAEPSWDGAAAGAMTARGLERWIAALAAAALHTRGVCLLFDDVDRVQAAPWKEAFVAALRFTFQASTGVTPVYSLWTLFGDETLAGSNYFRNVTRPLFLQPLDRSPSPAGGAGERQALVDLGLPRLPPLVAARLFALAGGHPQLLHHALSDLCESLPHAEAAARLDPDTLVAQLGPERLAAQRARAAALLARTPRLAAILRDLDGAPGEPLSRGLVASGLVDHDEAGRPIVPELVRAALG